MPINLLSTFNVPGLDGRPSSVAAGGGGGGGDAEGCVPRRRALAAQAWRADGESMVPPTDGKPVELSRLAVKGGGDLGADDRNAEDFGQVELDVAAPGGHADRVLATRQLERPELSHHADDDAVGREADVQAVQVVRGQRLLGARRGERAVHHGLVQRELEGLSAVCLVERLQDEQLLECGPDVRRLDVADGLAGSVPLEVDAGPDGGAGGREAGDHPGRGHADTLTWR